MLKLEFYIPEPVKSPSLIATKRLEHNLKQTDLALILEVTPQTILKWEGFKNMPKSSEVYLLSCVLGVSCDDICKNFYDHKYFKFFE